MISPMSRRRNDYFETIRKSIDIGNDNHMQDIIAYNRGNCASWIGIRVGCNRDHRVAYNHSSAWISL